MFCLHFLSCSDRFSFFLSFFSDGFVAEKAGVICMSLSHFYCPAGRQFLVIFIAVIYIRASLSPSRRHSSGVCKLFKCVVSHRVQSSLTGAELSENSFFFSYFTIGDLSIFVFITMSLSLSCHEPSIKVISLKLRGKQLLVMFHLDCK